MKKLELPKWKTKKRLSFRFYFIFFTVIIICLSVGLALGFSKIDFFVNTLNIPDFVILIVLSLVIGGVLSYFVGKLILYPVKKIRNAMTEVSQGNYNVTIGEESNIDEIEDINHAFNLMTKELRSTEVIQTDFISNVSHEFKTPLTAIQGYTAMLESDDLSAEERKEYTEKISYNLRRMTDLISNILLLSKLDNQGIDSQKEKFPVDEQIRQEILATEPKWTEKNIDFEVDLEEVYYYGNGGLILNIWSNLLSNAIKFSPEGGKIAIELKQYDGYIYFSVSDEGEGIKDGDRQHIFNKFYQSDTSRKQEGNGLGLAIVKRVVDIYGGEVEVENVQPHGSKFIVRLPVD